MLMAMYTRTRRILRGEMVIQLSVLVLHSRWSGRDNLRSLSWFVVDSLLDSSLCVQCDMMKTPMIPAMEMAK